MTTTTHTITVEIHGHVYTRTSEHHYPHATKVYGAVRFHRTFEAAKRRAGSGPIFSTSDAIAPEAAPKAGYCTVCKGEATPGIITSRTASGAIVTSPCYGPAHKA